jgi:hypothetical protein
MDKVKKIKNTKKMRENYKKYFLMEETEKKKEKTHIYFIYYNIIYLFFKIQKKKIIKKLEKLCLVMPLCAISSVPNGV